MAGDERAGRLAVLGVLRRLPWAICCALFVCLVPSSASWAATGPQQSSASSWRSAGSSWGWAADEPAPVEPSPSEPPAPSDPAEPSPEPPAVTETVTETPAPEVIVKTVEVPVESEALTAEDGSTVVSLSTEQMALFLLWGSLSVLVGGVVVVRSLRGA